MCNAISAVSWPRRQRLLNAEVASPGTPGRVAVEHPDLKFVVDHVRIKLAPNNLSVSDELAEVCDRAKLPNVAVNAGDVAVVVGAV